jgi:outer membrane protein assembly factor BamD (BamD/ComL family)
MEERTLLEDARAALQRGDTTAALERLNAHREQFPASGLSEERDALLVREAVRAGSYGEAREWLRAFREHYPESPLLPVLESALKEARESQDKP